MNRLPFLLVLLLLASSAVAQNESQPIDGAVAEGEELVDDVVEQSESPLDVVGDALRDAGEGVQKGVEGLGDIMAGTAKAIGKAFASTGKGLGIAGLAIGVGLGAMGAGITQGVGAALGWTGAAMTGAILWGGGLIGSAGAAIGSGLAAVGGLYASFVGSLRPDAMPPAAFGAVVASGAAASGGAGGWAGWQALRKWGWIGGSIPAIGGFSRIANDQLLEHPVRQDIFNVIQTSPGIHASQIARDVGVGWGTVSHHLDKLAKANLVATRKVNNQKCYFENGGAVGSSDMEMASAVKGDTAASIASFVHNHPMSSQKALAEALGISPALASFHVKKLVNLGVLDKMRHGKETLLTTSQAMRRVIDSDRDPLAALDASQAEGLQYRG